MIRRRLISTAAAALLSLAMASPLAAQTSPSRAVLVADSLRVEGRNRLVADGHVEAFFEGNRISARRIIYDRIKDQLIIEGPITLDDGKTTVVLADHAELDARLENGLLMGARMIMDERVQIAATQINRVGGRYSQLYKVAATSCRVCDSATPPLWQIRAEKTTHDSEARQLYFENAQLRVLDVPIFWLPRLRLPDPTQDRATGFLIPKLKQNSQLGLGLKIPYFIRMGDHRDLTLTPYVSPQTRTLELRYRQAFQNGRISFSGALSDDSLQTKARGYLFGKGHFDMARNYQLDFNIQAVSDRTYLLDYDYSDMDRLKSDLTLSRVSRDEYVRAALINFQTLREGENNSELPTIFAEGTYEKRYYPKGLGGIAKVTLEAHSHYRYSDTLDLGRDVNRASAALDWQRTWTLPAGIRAELKAGVALDGFELNQTSGVDHDTMITPQSSLTLRWPMMTSTARGASHILEPMAMIGWVGGSPLSVPNEESTRVEFDEGNLLSLSHFPSYDRRERGSAAALGLSWTRLGPRGGSSTLVLGQVFRDAANPEFSYSSGLSGKASSLLVAGQLQGANGLNFSARGVFDKGLQASKAEARAGWQTPTAGFGASYVWLGPDLAEDRTETVSEWLLDGYYRVSRHWTGSAGWRYDVAGDNLAEASLGLTYRNECVDVNLSLSRRYTSSTILEPSTSLDFTVNLTGFSAGKTDQSYTRSCRNP